MKFYVVCVRFENGNGFYYRFYNRTTNKLTRTIPDNKTFDYAYSKRISAKKCAVYLGKCNEKINSTFVDVYVSDLCGSIGVYRKKK